MENTNHVSTKDWVLTILIGNTSCKHHYALCLGFWW